jgi:hypothetical protein
MALIFVGPPEIGGYRAEFGAVDGKKVIVCQVDLSLLKAEAGIERPAPEQLLAAFCALKPRIYAAARHQYEHGRRRPKVSFHDLALTRLTVRPSPARAATRAVRLIK